VFGNLAPDLAVTAGLEIVGAVATVGIVVEVGTVGAHRGIQGGR